MNMRIVTIQSEHRDSDSKEERIRNICETIKKSGESDLVLLPEMWNTGFFSYDKYSANAETDSGETVLALSDMARECETNIFTGSFIEKDGGKLYNTALFIDRNGDIKGKYRKIHLFADEAEYISRGEDITVCKTDIGIVGMSICYDLRFPELYRALSKRGAEIMLSCYALPAVRAEHWRILTPARALENQAFFASCGCAGVNEGVEYSGGSMVVSPYGSVIGEAKKRGDVIDTSIDISKAREYRKSFPALCDRILF